MEVEFECGCKLKHIISINQWRFIETCDEHYEEILIQSKPTL